MKIVEIEKKVNNYYRRGGFKAVWDRAKEILPVKLFSIQARLICTLHDENLSSDAQEMINQWFIYLYFKRKYSDIINNSNYLSNWKEKDSLTPKIIWWCWLQGEINAPALCKACLKSLYINYPDYDIRVITLENLHQYVHMPPYIDEKFSNGQIGAAHYSDILRTLLLIENGGVWIDSTVFSSKRASDILEQPFFFYQNWMKENKAIICSNWMLVSQKENPILKLTRDLLFQYWKESDFAVHYYIYHFFFHMAAEKYHELWAKVPLYSNVPVHILQSELFNPYNEKRFNQIMQMADFHKLTHHLNADTEGDVSGSNYEYIIEEMERKMNL